MKIWGIVILCLLFGTSNNYAQHNIYINENNRIRIVNNVDKIEYDPEAITFWSNTTPSTVNISSVGLMSLNEKDSWRVKVMPEIYLADFNYDIAFEEEDMNRVKAEPEITDARNALYDDY